MAGVQRKSVVTDEEKQLLLKRYLDIVWIDDVTEMKCVRCDRVPIHHYVSNCLHLFCRNCRTVFSDGGRWRCPSCREYVRQLSDQDWQLEDKIYQIRANCPNKKYGCHYKGQLSTIPGHLRGCKDTREAALPAEFKGITLDTVSNAILSLRETIGEMRHEVREMVDGLKANVYVLTNEVNEQKGQLANAEQVRQEQALRDAKEIQQLSYKIEQQQALIEKNITQDDSQLAKLNVTMGGVQSEVTEWKEQCETNYKKLKECVDKLKADRHKQKQQLDKVEPLLNDEKKWRDAYETEWKQTNEKNDELKKDLNVIRWDLQEQKEQLAQVKPIVKEWKDDYKSNKNKAKTLEMKMDGLTTNLNELVQSLNEQKEQLANVTCVVKDVKELKDECEAYWKQTGMIVDGLSDNIKGMTHVREKEANDALEMQQLRSKVKDLETLMKTQWSSVNSQIKGVMDQSNAAEKRTQPMMDQSEAKLTRMQMVTIGQTQMTREAFMTMTEVYDWDITDIQSKDGQMSDRCSEVFPFTGYHYGGKAKLAIYSDLKLFISLQLIDCKNTKQAIDTNSMPKITWVLKDLSSSPHKRDSIKTRCFLFKTSLEYETVTYAWSTWPSSVASGPPHLLSNRMKLKVLVEPPSVARSFFSNDGILL